MLVSSIVNILSMISKGDVFFAEPDRPRTQGNNNNKNKHTKSNKNNKNHKHSKLPVPPTKAP